MLEAVKAGKKGLLTVLLSVQHIQIEMNSMTSASYHENGLNGCQASIASILKQR